MRARYQARAREALASEVFDAAQNDGIALSSEDAIDEALSV